MNTLKKVIKSVLQKSGYDIYKLTRQQQVSLLKPRASKAILHHQSVPINDKVFFLVTCYGLSASNWFAFSLNSHPQITCTHSEESLLAEKHMHTNERLARDVENRYAARIMRPEIALDDFFNTLTKQGDTPVYGGVHTHRLSDLHKIESVFRGKTPFRLMNLVRHPVSLVNSGAGHTADLISYDIYMLAGLINSILAEKEFFLELTQRHKLNILDNAIICFIGGCTNFFDLCNDIKTIYTPEAIKMEQLTTDRNYYKKTVQKLVQGKIDISDEYVDKVFNIGTVNQHRRGERKQPEQFYAEWLPWQRECFAYCMDKTGLLPHYQQLGYDFSFM